MTRLLLQGVWPASLTPFDRGGAVDEPALLSHLGDLASVPGVTALVVNGHAGEATALDRAEKRAVVEAARRVAGTATGIVAGVIADTAREAVTLGQDAAAAGADALLLFPPPVLAGAGERREAMALRFVSEVADGAGLPIVLFQLSLASGHGFSKATLVRLCREAESIVAVKEGSDVPAAYEDNLAAIRALDRKVAVFTTNNTWLMASLAYGADGILSGIGSVASPILAELLATMGRGDLEAARTANARLLPLCRAFYRAPACDMHNRMKTALNLMGKLPSADPRPPLLPIAPAERAAIAQALVEAGLLARPTAAAA